MLTRILKPNTTIVAVRKVNHIRMFDSLRYKSYSNSSEVQHGSHHDDDDVDHHGHHDPYKALYERLWQQKATLDWLPKPEGNWQEINGKKQAYYNQLLVGGIVAFAVSLVYLRVVVVARSGALTKPPYHLIGNEDFPGSKYDDATEAKEKEK